MKHLLLTLAMLAVCFYTAEAQNEITIHVNGRPLAELITAEQQKSLQTLNITGKLTEEDYAFIRNNSLPKLKVLNLRKADIDTIPAKAFYNYDKYHRNKEYQIMLPEELVYIGDSAFLEANVRLVLSGKFPKRGTNTTSFNSCVLSITLTEDNEYCKPYIGKNGGSYILSTDGKILYYSHDCVWETIPEGVETIAERAFEARFCRDIDFPKSLKEIGNYAFSHLYIDRVSSKADFKFSSKEPPVLGEKVFSFRERSIDPTLYIPETWKELYIEKDEQWKIFKDVEYWTPPTANINTTLSPNQITFHQTGNTLLCTAPKAVKLEVYTMDAVKVGEASFINGTATVTVNQVPATYLYIVTYPDGRRESGKVRSAL